VGAHLALGTAGKGGGRCGAQRSWGVSSAAKKADPGYGMVEDAPVGAPA
jgi:hypothetical protein